MQTAVFGAYLGSTDETLVNVRAGDKGVPLVSLLPASASGDNFGAFPVASFFDYVQVCLVTPQQWSQLRQSLELSKTAGQAPKKPAPGFDLEAYDLIDDNDKFDYEKLIDLVAIVGRIYDHRPFISPQAGLFYNLWRAGLTPEEIFQHIIGKAGQGEVNQQQVLQLDRVQSSTEFKSKAADTMKRSAARVAEAQLKKKRKQGQVNRKKGRR